MQWCRGEGWCLQVHAPSRSFHALSWSPKRTERLSTWVFSCPSALHNALGDAGSGHKVPGELLAPSPGLHLHLQPMVGLCATTPWCRQPRLQPELQKLAAWALISAGEEPRGQARPQGLIYGAAAGCPEPVPHAWWFCSGAGAGDNLSNTCVQSINGKIQSRAQRFFNTPQPRYVKPSASWHWLRPAGRQRRFEMGGGSRRTGRLIQGQGTDSRITEPQHLDLAGGQPLSSTASHQAQLHAGALSWWAVLTPWVVLILTTSQQHQVCTGTALHLSAETCNANSSAAFCPDRRVQN